MGRLGSGIHHPSLGGALDPRNVGHYFDRVCEDAGLGHWHPHELRHSAASLMLAAGVPLEVVSEVLGHASIRMTADGVDPVSRAPIVSQGSQEGVPDGSPLEVSGRVPA